MAEQELMIEEVSIEDAPALLECLQAVMQETHFITWDSKVVQNQADVEIFIQQQNQALDSICLVAKLGNNIIGLVNVVDKAGQGDLFIAVKKAYWGYGIGSMLMEVIEDWARQTPGLSTLCLTVQERNKSGLALYRKFGFEVVSVEEDGVRIRNGERLTVYHMNKLV